MVLNVGTDHPEKYLEMVWQDHNEKHHKYHQEHSPAVVVVLLVVFSPSLFPLLPPRQLRRRLFLTETLVSTASMAATVAEQAAVARPGVAMRK